MSKYAISTDGYRYISGHNSIITARRAAYKCVITNMCDEILIYETINGMGSLDSKVYRIGNEIVYDLNGRLWKLYKNGNLGMEIGRRR